MIRRSAVLRADCAHPSVPRHPPCVSLLGRYLSHVLWKVAVLVFLYELTGACFSALHFEQVKKIYLSCIPQHSPSPPTPRLRFCAFTSVAGNILFCRIRPHLSVGTAAPVTMHRGYHSGDAEYCIFRRWFTVCSFRRFETSVPSSSGSNCRRRITN